MGLNFLNTIVEYKHQILAAKKDYYTAITKKAFDLLPEIKVPGIFHQSISKPGVICLIAEIKKASPSAGIIRIDFDIAKIARIYADHGASALSVLTEDKYFLGAPECVQEASKAVTLPILAKDFIISQAQICEAKLNGARAVLLIAAILSDNQLVSLIQSAKTLGLDILMEVHDECEIDRVLKHGATIIGVNNRDLKSLEVNLKASERLIPRIPKNITIVAESGLRTNDDIRRMRDLGVNAVLIGETFMRAKDIGKKIIEIMKG